MLKPVEILAQLNQFVFSIDLVGYPSHGTSWHQTQRKQNFFTVWLMTKGRGEFQIDGQLYIAEPGKLFVFLPGMIVERKNVGEEPLVHYVIKFSFAEVYHKQGKWTFNKGEDVPFPLQGGYTIQNVPQITLMFEQLYNKWNRKGPIVIMEKNIIFQELWLTIIRDLRAQKVSGSTTGYIDASITHMTNHYSEDISLDDLALITGISKSHFARLFKKYTGYSPIEYLTHIRMGRAKELITLTDYKLKEIAIAVGYKDEFYFSRIFKKSTGLSPTEYASANKGRSLPPTHENNID